MIEHKIITTHKFIKNILYMIHPFPCHIIYSRVHSYKHNKLD